MFIVEGNIGVGKSTFLSGLASLNPGIEVVPEPKDDWTRPVAGESLLDNFYQNPRRWAYTMETLALMRRSTDYAHYKTSSAQHIQVLERSMYSGHYCFAQNGWDEGYFSTLEWHLYNEWAHFLFSRCPQPTGFIYLQADPDVCFARIQKRNRTSESSLSRAYVEKIHAYHNHFLIEKKNVHTSIARIPVLVLDCNEEFATKTSLSNSHQEAILEFFAATKNSEKSFDLSADFI